MTPYWLEYCLDEETQGKIAEFGYNVFNLDRGKSIDKDAENAIAELRKFFTSIGIPEHLKDVGFKEVDLPVMANNCLENREKPEINGFKQLKEEDVLKIYKMAF